MKTYNKRAPIAALACAIAAGILFFGVSGLSAQEFGFGAPETATAIDARGSGKPAVVVGGSLSFSLLGFPFALADGDFSDSTALPEARLSLGASGSKVDAKISLRFNKGILESDPATLLDEAKLRVFLGGTTLEGGLMRAAWGRADSLSVLDIINPRDLSDLTLRDENDRKIAVPMLRLTESLGERASVELIYLPWFEGDRIAISGPWLPAKLAAAQAMTGQANPFSSPDTARLDYGQAGLRLATGLGGIDLGLQYFYGYLTTPAYDMNPASIAAAGGKIPVIWNRYHQLGLDAAVVLAGFNIRLEAGANLTEDTAGNDPLVYNPAIVWAAGFDKALFAGIDLNVQAMGKLRLLHDKIASPLDVEYGSNVTTTQIAALLSRSFARDAVKIELLGLLGAEKLDYMIEPGVTLAVGDAEIALRGRYFGGNVEGDLGQFRDSGYVRFSVSYKF